MSIPSRFANTIIRPKYSASETGYQLKIQGSDFHFTAARILSFASHQFVNSAAPCRTRSSLAGKMSRRQEGEGTLSALRQRWSQICSIARSLSEVVI